MSTKNKRNKDKSAMKIAKEALSLAKKINLRSEVKVSDKNTTHSQITWTGSISGLITNIAQGDSSVNQRIGDRINIYGVELRGYVHSDLTTPVVCNVRMIIFWDLENSIASVDEVLATSGDVGAPFAPYNRENSLLYQILWDKTYKCIPESSNEFNLFNLKRFYKRGKNVSFETGVTTIINNNLKLLLVSDGSSGTCDAVTYCRVLYKDL